MRAVFKWIGKYISFSEVAYFLLIYLSLYSLLLGIELVVRGTSLEVLRLPILLGILTGWLLSRTRLKLWQAAVAAFLVGVLVTFLHLSGVGTAILSLLKTSSGYLLRLIFRRPVDPTQVFLQLSGIQARASEGLTSLGVWLSDLITGFSVYNQISTLFSWSFLLWMISCGFAWMTYRRHQPIWGVLLTGTMLAVLMTYTLEKRFSLVLLLGAGLMLIGMVNHDIKQQEWKKKAVPGKEIVGEQVYLVILALSILTMGFSGIMPSIRISPIADRFERLIYQTDESSDREGSGGEIAVGDFSNQLYSIQRFSGLPRQKLIGSGPELARRVVMVVSYPTTAFVETDLPNAARYWRSYTYDQYTGLGWQSSPTEEIQYQPGQEIKSVYSESSELITQEIRLTNAVRGALYSSGPPVTLDHEVLVSWRTTGEDGSTGGEQVLAEEDIFAVTLDTIQYQVRSLVSRAADEDLRSAPEIYPDWVANRYLQLPDTVPQRVLALAQDITANQTTAYDRAKSIESFLRTYPYDLNLPAPPTDRDVVDYFLFDLQTGYCDYYATSMVVLARSVGLPARAVVGYVGGQYDQENAYYLVTEADAHTWVEIYFPDFGWIPFEPTASRQVIDDESFELPLPPELENLPQATSVTDQNDFPWWQAGGFLSLAAFVGVLVWNRADLLRLLRMDTNQLILIVYERLYRYGRWIGLNHRKSDTPYEFNQKINRALRDMNQTSRKTQRVSASIQHINQLTAYAVRANFSAQKLDHSLNDRIVRIWINLRMKLRLMAWNGFWKSQLDKINILNRQAKQADILGDGAADGTS